MEPNTFRGTFNVSDVILIRVISMSFLTRNLTFDLEQYHFISRYEPNSSVIVIYNTSVKGFTIIHLGLRDYTGRSGNQT